MTADHWDFSPDMIIGKVTRDDGSTPIEQARIWAIPASNGQAIIFQQRSPFYTQTAYGTALLIALCIIDWPDDYQLNEPIRNGDTLHVPQQQPDGTTVDATYTIRGNMPYPGEHIELDVIMADEA